MVTSYLQHQAFSEYPDVFQQDQKQDSDWLMDHPRKSMKRSE